MSHNKLCNFGQKRHNVVIFLHNELEVSWHLALLDVMVHSFTVLQFHFIFRHVAGKYSSTLGAEGFRVLTLFFLFITQKELERYVDPTFGKQMG